MSYSGLRRVAANQPARRLLRDLPLPHRGWNTRDPLDVMDPGWASVMDNWVSLDGKVSVREGFTSHATGVTGGVRTLMRYARPLGNTIFASSDDKIYNVTGAGPAGAAVQSGFANGAWAHLNFSDLGGPKLVIVNGADGIRTYNGTTWATSVVTGTESPNSAKFRTLTSHQRRLWFAEAGELSAWYFNDPLSTSGAMTRFPIGALCVRGGGIASLATWTRDGGDGMDDLLVIVTTEGEVLIYQGIDPAVDFTLVGSFAIPRPVGGTRCTLKVGGTLWLMTEAGITSLDAVMAGSGQLATITGPIQPSFVAAAKSFPEDLRWQMTILPSREWVICNIPRSTSSEQFVLVMQANVWSRFTGLNATTWIENGGRSYFGTEAGTVQVFGGVQSDGGKAITATVVFGINRLRMLGPIRWIQAQMSYRGTSDVKPRGEIVFDTLPRPFLAISEEASVSWGSPWGTLWPAIERQRRSQFLLRGFGTDGAFGVTITAKNQSFSILSVIATIEQGSTI